jgi:hypothetical protein
VNRAFHVFCLLLAASSPAWALIYGTPEGGFASNLANAASTYASHHEGRAPSAWSDIEDHLARPIDEAFRYVTPTKRYAFLSQPLSLPPPHKGELLLITRRPFREISLHSGFFGLSRSLREPGRYIIYRTQTGQFRSSYVNEPYVQQAFRGFESLLPTSDSEAMRTLEAEVEAEVRRRSILNWCAGVVTIALLAIFFSWLWRIPVDDIGVGTRENEK